MKIYLLVSKPLRLIETFLFTNIVIIVMYHSHFVDEKQKIPNLPRKGKEEQVSDSSDEEDSQVRD